MWPFRKKLTSLPEINMSLLNIELNVVNYYHMVEGLLKVIEKGLNKGDKGYELALSKVTKGRETSELLLREVVTDIKQIRSSK